MVRPAFSQNGRGFTISSWMSRCTPGTSFLVCCRGRTGSFSDPDSIVPYPDERRKLAEIGLCPSTRLTARNPESANLEATRTCPDSMRFSRLRVSITLLSSTVLLFLLLYPEWQEASSKMPPEYRKEIGRGFLWSPPKSVAVGCYFSFEDCAETPASAFYPVVNRELVLMQSLALAVVTLLLLWLTRTGGRQSRVSQSPRTRIAISVSLALVVPIGGIPIAVHLVYLPGIIS